MGGSEDSQSTEDSRGPEDSPGIGSQGLQDSGDSATLSEGVSDQPPRPPGEFVLPPGPLPPDPGSYAEGPGPFSGGSAYRQVGPPSLSPGPPYPPAGPGPLAPGPPLPSYAPVSMPPGLPYPPVSGPTIPPGASPNFSASPAAPGHGLPQEGFLQAPAVGYPSPAMAVLGWPSKAPVWLPVAPFGKRIGAFVVDSVVEALLFFGPVIAGAVMALPVARSNSTYGIVNRLGLLVTLFIVFWVAALLYRPFCEAKWGKTVGKVLFGLRIVMEDGRPCTVGAAVLRHLGFLVDGLFSGAVGLVVAIVDDTGRYRRVGDRMAHTVVVDDRAYSAHVLAEKNQVLRAY